MAVPQLPSRVESVFYKFFTCEFSTIGKGGQPSTWPVLPIYLAARRQFVILTPIGLSRKANNIRRNPRVSLLFSEPTGSDLENPPAVLVQGDACVREEIAASIEDFGEELYEAIKVQAQKVIRDQPALGLYMKNPVTRYLMDWYFMRLVITITPKRISWWDQGDFNILPENWEPTYVG